MNFSALNLFRKLLITALSITGLLISKPSFANNGVEIKTTYVLNHSQYLAALMRHNASEVYILYRGIWLSTPGLQDVLRKDTIVNYKKFTETYPYVKGFRLIYETNDKIDSLIELDPKFQITKKGKMLNNRKMQFVSFDSSLKKTDEFIYDYSAKLLLDKSGKGTLNGLLREYEIYDSYDRNNYGSGVV